MGEWVTLICFAFNFPIFPILTIEYDETSKFPLVKTVSSRECLNRTFSTGCTPFTILPLKKRKFCYNFLQIFTSHDNHSDLTIAHHRLKHCKNFFRIKYHVGLKSTAKIIILRSNSIRIFADVSVCVYYRKSKEI